MQRRRLSHFGRERPRWCSRRKQKAQQTWHLSTIQAMLLLLCCCSAAFTFLQELSLGLCLHILSYQAGLRPSGQ